MAKPSPRINTLNAIGLISLAALLDIISLIPLINIAVDLLAMIIFGLWFYLLGVGFINPRRFITALAALIVEFIPILSGLPGFTVAVIATIVMVKSEDRLGFKLPLLGK